MWKGRQPVDTGGLLDEETAGGGDLSWERVAQKWSVLALGARSKASTAVTKKIVAEFAQNTAVTVVPFVKNLVADLGGDPSEIRFPETFREVETVATVPGEQRRLKPKRVGLCMGPKGAKECFLFFNDGDLMSGVDRCPKCGTWRYERHSPCSSWATV